MIIRGSTPLVRIALLGVGRIGAGHAAALAADPAVELTVCDADVERAVRVAHGLESASGRPVVAATVEEILGSPGSPDRVDGVVIATPTTTHEELVIRTARAGLPLFCEKPVAADLAGTERCIRAVHEAGVVSQIGFQRRFDPGYAEARRRVRSGELGEVHRLHVLTCDQTPPPEQFVASSGGIWRDCLIHDIDILRWVTGREVEEVFAFGSVRGADYFATHDDVDEGVSVLRLDDGTLATAQTSRNNGRGYDVRMEIAGTRGSAVVGLDPKAPLVSVEPGVSFPDETPWDDFIARFRTCYEVELAAFVEVVAGRRESPCTVDDALEALRVALALGVSRREGRPVRVAEIRDH